MDTPKFSLHLMMKPFARVGTLKVIDTSGKAYAFTGAPAPNVTMRLNYKSLYHKIVFNPGLNAAEAFMHGRMTFEFLTPRNILTLISINRIALYSYPAQKILRRISGQFKRFK